MANPVLASVQLIVNTMQPRHAVNIAWRLAHRFPDLVVTCEYDDDNGDDVDVFERFRAMFPAGIPTLRGTIPTVGQLLSVNPLTFDRRLKPTDRQSIEHVCRRSSGKFPAVKTERVAC